MFEEEGARDIASDARREHERRGAVPGRDDAVDIILLDLGLPDAQGLEAVRRAHAAAPRVPLVVLTGLDDETLALEALQEGRGRLPRQGPDRDPRAAAGPALRDRTQDPRRGAVRREGTRPGVAQVHRRRRALHGHRGQNHLPQSGRRAGHRLVLRGGCGPAPAEVLRVLDGMGQEVSQRLACRWRSISTRPCSCRRAGSSSAGTASRSRSRARPPPSTTAKGKAAGAVIVFRDVSAARAMAAADDPFRRARLPDRPAQSNAAERSPRPGDRPGAAAQEEGRGAVPGSRRLQAHQRLAGAYRSATSCCSRSPGAW